MCSCNQVEGERPAVRRGAGTEDAAGGAAVWGLHDICVCIYIYIYMYTPIIKYHACFY